MHNALGHEKYTKVSKELSALLEKVKTVYFEIDRQYNTSSSEDMLFSLIETSHPSIIIKELETESFQKAMLDQSSIICGSEQYLVPWHSYEIIKKEWRITRWMHAWLRNIASMTVKKEDLQNIMKHEVDLMFKVETEYLDELIEEYSSFDQQRLLFPDRNKAWMDSIVKEEEPFCIAVGAGHLPGEQGMITLLENHGFVCTPLHFIDHAFEKAKVKEYAHIFISSYQDELSEKQKEAIQQYLADVETECAIWANHFFAYLESQNYIDAFLNIKDKRDTSLFMSAVSSGEKQLVQVLLDYGADLHRSEPMTITKKDGAVEVHNTTPLAAAIVNRHAVIVDLLLQKGASIEQDFLGFPLISHIFGAKNKHLLLAALKNNISPHAEITVNLTFPLKEPTSIQTSPLHFAIINSDFEAVKILIAYGAEVNQKIDPALFETESLLTLALNNADYRSAQLLIAYGVQASVRDIQQCDVLLQRLSSLPENAGTKEAIKQFNFTKYLCSISIVTPPIHQTVSSLARGAVPAMFLIKDYCS